MSVSLQCENEAPVATEAVRPDARPIFIVGCPRSGTTLLATLFDRHSQVAVPPETHFYTHFRLLTPKRRTSHSTAELTGRFVADQYTCDLNLAADALTQRVGADAVALPQFFDAAMREFAAGRGKSVWAEKTPEHLFCVDEILSWYPDARIVCIIRDGRDATMSMDALPWTLTPSRGHAAIWRDAALYAQRSLRQYPEQFHLLRFEDLLTEPERVLTAAMQHAGLQFEPRQLQRLDETGAIPAWESGVKQNVFKDLDPSRAYAWKRSLSPTQLRLMNSMMHTQLRDFGYETPERPEGSMPARMYDGVMNAFYRQAYSHQLFGLRRRVRGLLGWFTCFSPHSNFRKEQQPEAAAAK
jgi:hypothetical protein